MSGDIRELLTEYRVAHDALNRCWTRSVGTSDYVKSDWMTLDNALSRVFSDRARDLGHDGPLLESRR